MLVLGFMPLIMTYFVGCCNLCWDIAVFVVSFQCLCMVHYLLFKCVVDCALSSVSTVLLMYVVVYVWWLGGK